MQATGIIIGGKSVPCIKPVYNWNDHGMKFVKGKGARDRKQVIKNIVIHWTAGEGSGEGIFNVLNTRGLGVDFHIDPAGKICQFSDPKELATFCSSQANDFSVGIEISNYAFGKVLDKNRKITEQVLRGRKIKVADFYDAQMQSLLALIDSLCGALNIKKQFPAKNGKFYADSIDLKFEGIIGHINLSGTTKIDPGNQPFDYLHQHGYQPHKI